MESAPFRASVGNGKVSLAIKIAAGSWFDLLLCASCADLTRVGVGRNDRTTHGMDAARLLGPL